MAIELSFEAVTCLLIELANGNKATADYLSSADGKFSFINTSDDDHKATLGKVAVNDNAERPFAALTWQLQTFSCLGVQNAGGIAQARVNGDFRRDHQRMIKRVGERSEEEQNSELGEFHKLPHELQQSLLSMAIKHAPKLRSETKKALFEQRESKRKRVEQLQEKQLKSAEEEYVLALYYHDKYDSEACWKTAAKVDEQLEQLRSNTAKLNALKEQIRIRVVGFGWTEFHITWSTKRVARTPDMLADHLKTILKAEASRPIPRDPPANLPTRKDVSTLGTLSKDVAAMDQARSENDQEFKASANQLRDERERDGFGDRYMEQQPVVMPAYDTLLNKKIEKLFEMTEPDTTTNLNWCQGEVMKVSKGGSNKVTIRWNPEHLKEGEPETSREQLMRSKWNPKTPSDGAWRIFIE